MNANILLLISFPFQMNIKWKLNQSEISFKWSNTGPLRVGNVVRIMNHDLRGVKAQEDFGESIRVKV